MEGLDNAGENIYQYNAPSTIAIDQHTQCCNLSGGVALIV